MNRKVIRVTITLRGLDKNGKPEVFTSEGNYNQLQSTGLRVRCSIINGNGAISPTANIQVYGLALDKMKKLMRVQWNTLGALLNTVLIEAGEEGGTLTRVYEGNITFAKIDMSTAPNQFLNIESQSAIVDAFSAADPIKFDAGLDAAFMIETIAKQMGYQFENNGATKIMTDSSTYEGSNLNKIQKIASAANFDLYTEQNLIAICPKGGARQLKIPVITPSTGLIGYPTPDIRGISFTCFYDPAVRFGGIVKVDGSEIDVCNGEWRVYGSTTTLEANAPNGGWWIECNATWRNSTDAAIAK